MGNANTIGFWKNGARYTSSVIHKKQIPTWCRIQLIKNSYKKNDAHPDYVGYFNPCKEDENLDIKKPLAVLRASAKLDFNKVFDAVRVYLMDYGDKVMDGIQCGIDSTGLAEDFAEYVYNQIKQ